MSLRKNHLACLLLTLALVGCTTTSKPTPHVPKQFESGYTHDVIDISEHHLSPEYWAGLVVEHSGNILPEQILNEASIALLNASTFALNADMVVLEDLSPEIAYAELVSKISSISKASRDDRYYANAQKVSEQDYAAYRANLALETLHNPTQSKNIQWAMVVTRTSMRTFPTNDKIYKPDSGTDLDRFQETGLFPSDILAILHESKDGKWYLAQSYNYLAWVQKKHVALGSRDEIFAYEHSKDFVTVTGSKVSTTFIPGLPAISELQLDMGTTLPLISHAEHNNNVHGQNPYASYVVRLPTRTESGQLMFQSALLARSNDITVGHLPYTDKNLIRQSFKFLGERYGWGESYNGRDCTGFVVAVFKTFGLQLPRNSGDQGRSPAGINVRFPKNTKSDQHESKLAQINNMRIGDLIYIPGHVMMYVGMSAGQPYVIHDVVGLGYNDSNGDFYKGILNGVSITPLLPLRLSQSTSYIDRIYNIKSLRQ